MKGLFDLMRNYPDLNVIEKSKVGDVATHCDRAKSGSCSIATVHLSTAAGVHLSIALGAH